MIIVFFFSSRRRHTRCGRDWSSDVCSSDLYNIQLPEAKPLSPEEQQELTERESLQIINTYAKDFFVDTIKNTNEGKNIGYTYFKERGFRDDTIEKFQLGYCPRSEKSFTEDRKSTR